MSKMDINKQEHQEAMDEWSGLFDLLRAFVSNDDVTGDDYDQILESFLAACAKTRIICRQIWEGEVVTEINEQGHVCAIAGWRQNACEEKCPIYDICIVSGNDNSHKMLVEIVDQVGTTSFAELSEEDIQSLKAKCLSAANLGDQDVANSIADIQG